MKLDVFLMVVVEIVKVIPLLYREQTQLHNLSTHSYSAAFQKLRKTLQVATGKASWQTSNQSRSLVSEQKKPSMAIMEAGEEVMMHQIRKNMTLENVLI